MNENNQLMVAPELQETAIAFTPEGEQLIQEALSKSALIGRVSDDNENNTAVEAQVSIKRVIKLIEDTRLEITKPLLERQRQIKAFCDEKSSELKAEMMRVGTLAASYVQLQEAKRRAEENARNEELARIERERMAALAQSKSHEQMEAVNEHYNEKAKVESIAAPAFVKPKAQQAKPDWEIVVNDIHLLARAHPSCVNVTPRISDIKSLIAAGVKVAGVTATPITKVGVRLSPSRTVQV